jgi:hypothetical protein
MPTVTLTGADSFRRFKRSRAAGCDFILAVLRYPIAWSIAGGLTTPAVAIFLVACVEHAFADFARIPYYDGAARRELEEMLDDLKDLTRELAPLFETTG